MQIDRRDFIFKVLPGTGLVAGSVLLPWRTAEARNAVTPLSPKDTWKNWAGNVQFVIQKISRPRQLKELQTIVASSEKIRVVGSGHSFSALVPTEGTLLDLGQMNRVLHIDKEKMQVSVEAGMTLHSLNLILAKNGMALANMGDIDEQTVAGLISTGTHGTGIKTGSLSDKDFVVGLTLVAADGRVVELSSEDSQNGPLLEAARLSLGLLGVIYSVTFKVVPAFRLRRQTRKGTLEEALRPENYLQNDHFKTWYFPFTDTCNMAFDNQTDRPVTVSGLKNWFQEIFLENIVLGLVMSLTSTTPYKMPSVMKFLASLLKPEDYTDDSYKVFTARRLVKLYNLDYVFPVEKVGEAVQIYKDLVADFAKRDIHYANLPLLLRFCRGDHGSLLSRSKGDGIFVSLDVISHTAMKGYEEFFKGLEERFILLGGRTHWGKNFYKIPASDTVGLKEFKAIRAEMDPSGKFQNKLTALFS